MILNTLGIILLCLSVPFYGFVISLGIVFGIRKLKDKFDRKAAQYSSNDFAVDTVKKLGGDLLNSEQGKAKIQIMRREFIQGYIEELNTLCLHEKLPAPEFSFFKPLNKKCPLCKAKLDPMPICKDNFKYVYYECTQCTYMFSEYHWCV